MNYPVRLCIAKTGRAKYISHLDFMRCIQRAVCRAKLPAAYSQGFHPHMQTAFAATLPLGFTSLAEIVELQLTDSIPYAQVQQRLNAALPENIHVTAAGKPQHAFKELTYAEYTIRIATEDPAQLHQTFLDFLAQEMILTHKKTKRGMKEVDLKPMVEVQDVMEESKELVLRLCLPAGSTVSLNPMLFLQAWQEKGSFVLDFPKICRTSLLTADRSPFF